MKKYPGLKLADAVEIASKEYKIDSLPERVEIKPDLGIAGVPALRGCVAYRSVDMPY